MEKNTRFCVLKKIAIILLAIVICYFIIPTPVNAVSWLVEAGGAMVDWILQLFIFLGDCILDLLQNNFISTQDVIIQAEASSQADFSAGNVVEILLGVLVIAIGVCIAIASFGTLSWASLAAIAGSIKVIGGVVLATAGGAALFVHGTSELVDDIQGKFDLPMIRYTPYEIFSGQIPVFDVNFIEPMESVKEEKEVINIADEIGEDIKEVTQGNAVNFVNVVEYVDDFKEVEENWKKVVNNIRDIIKTYDIDGTELSMESDNIFYKYCNDAIVIDDATYNYIPIYMNFEDSMYDDENFTVFIKWFTDDEKGAMYELNELFDLINTHEGNENVQADLIENDARHFYARIDIAQDCLEKYMNDMGLLNQDVVVGNNQQASSKNNVSRYIDTEVKEYKSTSSILQSSISTWYKVLRTVALVGLLSVVVYIGIRILFTSIAEDKAKYKKMIIDWIVAICILFVLHYLMAFILTVSSSLTEIFVAKGEENILVALPAETEVDGERLPLSESNEPKFKDRPAWSTSFTGYVRLLAGSYNAGENNAGLMHIAYAIIYIVMVIYTLMFTFMYLKRAIYMAFLTMIAPLIALTYPLDKIKDGKAQAFSLWIREYIFNCLMQPIHLIIYTMVISTVMEYVQEHPIYALVALGFLIPAEQFIRKMFGFENAGTVSELAKFAGGAALMTGINKLSNLNKRKAQDENEDKNSKVRTKEENGYSLDIPSATSTARNSTSRTNTSTRRAVNTSQTPQTRIQNLTTQVQNENIDTSTALQNRQVTNNIIAQNNSITEGESRISQSDNTENNISNLIHTSGANNILEQNETNSSNIDTTTRSSSSGFIDRVSAGMNSVGIHYKNRAIKSKPLRTIGKWSGRIIGGAAIGTIGLAAGIASGDASKALSYTAAGAGVGGALGGTLAENAMDEARTIRTNFSKGYQGEAEYTNKKLDDKFFASSEYQKIINDHSLYPELLSGPIDQQKRIGKIQEEIMQYRKSGITDTKKMVKAMKLKLSPKQGVFAIQLAERIGKSGWNKEDTRLRYYNEYFSILGDEEEAKKIWEAIPKLLF